MHWMFDTNHSVIDKKLITCGRRSGISESIKINISFVYFKLRAILESSSLGYYGLIVLAPIIFWSNLLSFAVL